MPVVEAVTYITQALYLGVAGYVAWHAISVKRRSHYFVLAFFALLTIIIAYSWIQRIIEFTPGLPAQVIPVMLVLALPYILLRLAEEYSHVNHRHRRFAEAGLLASFALLIYPGIGNPLVVTALVAYFAAVSTYSARRFHIATADANGITRKRLGALSIASVLLGLALFSVALSAVTSGLLSEVIQVMRQTALAASALLYLAGFSPPTLLRRAWQEPELRHYLRRTLQLSRWTSTDETLRHIEQASAETLGAPHASVGLWNPETERIEFRRSSVKPGETIGGRAFLEQRPILSLDTVRDDPESKEIYERGEAYAVMAAPISGDDGVIGVIALHSPNPPIFAHDDLSLLTLLSDQIGVLLENRKHLRAQAELTAREESTRLKDEFLSVAAHDLKTPLTTILATGQYLERRLKSGGEESPELRSVVRLNRESKRLRTLVQQLLDASRIEHGRLRTLLESTDVSDLVQDVVDRVADYSRHQIEPHIPPGLTAECDPVRIQQLVENLLENAQKYSEPGTTIALDLRAEGDFLHLSVTDSGVGISPDDCASIFDRYFRSPQASNGSAQGIGLGLFICKEIVEQHGGEIRVESKLGEGSTFYVTMSRTGVMSSVP